MSLRSMKSYSLRKSKKILIAVYQLWRRKKRRLLPAQVAEIQRDLQALQQEIQKKNRSGASHIAHKCLDYTSKALKKTPIERGRDCIVGMGYALFVVFVLIRPMWFELYEIPTGSMRPTLKEQDRLVVSKTDFGINLPFTTKHLYFDPALARRSGIIVFTVAGLGVHDPDTKYFGIFPGKKQYVKRLMGLPGDTVFFYGGRLYGIDRDGRDISEQLQLPSLSAIDYVPIIRFDGGVSVLEPFRNQAGTGYRTAIVHQMNEPVARLTALGSSRFEGEVLSAPQMHNRASSVVENYWQLWGIGNYAKVMIKHRDEIRPLSSKIPFELDQDFYLEIYHHPNLGNLRMAKDQLGRLRPQFNLSRSILPLDEAHLKTLFNALYTARFVVKNGYVTRYTAGGSPNPSGHHHFLTRLEGVADGIYEYYHGQAYKILWGGVAKKLDPEHPLMRYCPDLARKMFNYGVDFDRRSALDTQQEAGRYGYFRCGDFYLMGAPIYKRTDPLLERFVAAEREMAEGANTQNPYVPFIDTGPPVDCDGCLDTTFIQKYGLQIPPEMYLALGDNHANSGDSRDFGFVPAGNLRGGPSFIFWPFGSRFGPPNQPSYPWLTLPNLLIWSVALVGIGFWQRNYRRHHMLPLEQL